MAFFAASVSCPADAVAAPNPTVSSYSVFAIDSLRAKGLTAATGNVGVNDGSLFVHDGLSAPTSDVVANVIRIDTRSSWQTLYSNGVPRTARTARPRPRSPHRCSRTSAVPAAFPYRSRSAAATTWCWRPAPI